MGKRTQEMLNERWKAKEEERLLEKYHKQIRKEKEAFYERSDKEQKEDEMLQLIINRLAELESR